MSDSSGNPTLFCRLKSWVIAHPISLLTSIIMLGYLVSFLMSQNPPWIELSVQAARQMVHGENVYDLKYGFAYPPARAMLAIPFLTLPHWAQLAAWWACNAAMLVLMCLWMWKLAGGVKLEPVTRFTADHGIWLAGMITGIFYVFNGLSNQSTDLVDGLFMVAGCIALSSRRIVLAATLLGVAAGLKATPLLWCAYLLWKREWLASLWLVVVAIGINFVPDLIARCPSAGTWLGGWINSYLAQFQNPDYMPGTWHSHIYLNQSLAGMINRTFLFDWTWTDSGMKVIQRPSTVPPMVFKVAWLLAGMALVGVCALACWKSRDKDRNTIVASSENALEYSLVMLLMVLLSPMSSKSHFGVLILPGIILAKTMWEQRSRLLGSLFIIANVIGIAALMWWGEYVAYVCLFYGAVTVKALLLLGGCGIAVTQLRNRQKNEATHDEREPIKLAA